WIRSEWRVTPNSRRARYYTLTDAGRERLLMESKAWERSTNAVGLILQAES
ncbi:MAG: helix-turn-helix transcriptional regulator, partial [Gemmatimonadetes bacterium]|nr:helix-turn-helix transcriptional regulator [Gemmatimonadota bacterium]